MPSRNPDKQLMGRTWGIKPEQRSRVSCDRLNLRDLGFDGRVHGFTYSRIGEKSSNVEEQIGDFAGRHEFTLHHLGECAVDDAEGFIDHEVVG